MSISAPVDRTSYIQAILIYSYYKHLTTKYHFLRMDLGFEITITHMIPLPSWSPKLLADKSRLVRATSGVSNISQTLLRSFNSQCASESS